MDAGQDHQLAFIYRIPISISPELQLDDGTIGEVIGEKDGGGAGILYGHLDGIVGMIGCRADM